MLWIQYKRTQHLCRLHTGSWLSSQREDPGLSKTIWRKKKLHGLSPRANYTDRATATCQRSDCQLLQIEGAT
jgi:hypothetical protein